MGVLALLIAQGASGAAAQGANVAVPEAQSFALADAKGLTLAGVKAEAVEYKGRKALKVTAEGESGFAFLNGTEFRDGTIELDMATHTTTPPGVRMPGFTGVAFRARTDGSKCELFYLRPGNAKAEDQAMRNHSVQYTSEPNFGWEKLRRNWPFIYESYAEIALDEWIHVKVDVKGRVAKLYLNGSANPALIVDGLKGEDLKGAIGLWGYADEESYFANVKVTNAKAEAIENGGEVAGEWEVKFATDAGPVSGTMKLVRQYSTVTGLWSGDLGPDQTVSGTWRDGYVELHFGGTWQDQPGTVTATMAGWVDGDAAKGRVKVEGRADGRWTAVRKKVK
jgi:hypothetical protein